MNQTRRNLLKQLGVFALIGGFSHQVVAGNNPDDESIGSGFVIQPENQETYLITQRRAPVTIMVGKDSHGVDKVSFCKEEIAPDDYLPIHKHMKEDELIYIEEGTGTFLLGETKHNVSKGSTAYVPQGEWHGLLNTGKTPLTMIFAYTPSGFENYFREIGTMPNEKMKELTAEDYSRIASKYQIVYKHSPPKWE